jgi:hypothetical protein
MRPIKAECPGCAVAIEGTFELPRLACLPPDQAAFLAEYILAGFSVKGLEERVGLSYPAIRSRLDRIIITMRSLSSSTTDKDERARVLDRLDRGEIKVDEAIRLLEQC